MRLLLVEDAVKIASFIKDGLKQEGFAVDYADNAEDGPHLALTEPYDLAVVGHMLPGIEGLRLPRNHRSTMFSQELEAGIMCGWDRGFRLSRLCTRGYPAPSVNSNVYVSFP